MERLARYVIRYRWWVVGFWVVALLAGASSASQLSGKLSYNFSMPGQEGSQTADKLAVSYGIAPQVAAMPVLTAPAGHQIGDYRAGIAAVADAIRATPGVQVADYAQSGDPGFLTSAPSGPAAALVPATAMFSTDLGGLAGSINHPLHLLNGRPPDSVASSAPPADTVPAELGGQLLSYNALKPLAHNVLASRAPDREFQVVLSGKTGHPGSAGRFGLEGADKMQVHQGERVRITMLNFSGYFHPMHLRGHTFASFDQGFRKDTINVLPGRSVSIDFDAANPGEWMYHCHNTYHSVMGMMATLSYT